MWFLRRIIDWLQDVADWFYEAYLEVWDWVWPFWKLGDPLWQLCNAFTHLAWYFEDFDEWVEDVVDRLRDILDRWDIFDLLEDWLEWAEWAWDWVKNAWKRVTDIVGDWWDITWPTVKGFIDIVAEGLDDLIEAWDKFWKVTFPSWTRKLDDLKATWDNFWTITFPTLVSFAWLGIWWDGRLKDISALIDSTLKTWFPFYDDLVIIWEDIKAFFVDPLQWVYDKLDEWFERFW